MTGIANVKDTDGQLVSDPGGINACFASFYSNLYSSRAGYTQTDLQAFLEDIQLPTVTEEARQRVDAPLTLKEIQQAIGFIQAGKTLGDDGEIL